MRVKLSQYWKRFRTASTHLPSSEPIVFRSALILSSHTSVLPTGRFPVKFSFFILVFFRLSSSVSFNSCLSSFVIYHKSKVVSLHDMVALRGEEVQLLLLDLVTRWGWLVNVTPRPPFSPGERTPGTHRIADLFYIISPIKLSVCRSSRLPVWSTWLTLFDYLTNITSYESRSRYGCLSTYFCVVLSCVSRGLATGWSAVQGVLPNVEKIFKILA
jgi:hypothetical protein